MTYVTIANVTMTIEAARSVEWAGVDVAADVARVRRDGNCDGLLAECLEGCEPEHEGDWRDYVSAVCAAAEAEQAEQDEAMIRHARHAAVGDTIGGSDGNAYRIVRFVSVDRAIVTLGDWDDVADDVADGGCTPRAMVEASS